MEPFSKKVFVKTYGCQMNVYDSERMRDVLAPLGYAETGRPEEADLVILNTCHIREKAAEKVYSELGKIRRMKRSAPRRVAEMLIAVAGCVAQAEGEEIVQRAPRRRPRLRPADLPPPAAASGARAKPPAAPSSKPSFRPKTNSTGSPPAGLPAMASPPSSPCRKAATSSAPSAWCPIRAAPNSRAPLRPGSGRGAEARRAGRARDHAARPERQCLSRRGRIGQR